jgi:hypothetical protein
MEASEPPPAPPTTLLSLPEELLAGVMVRLGDDDYHMLTLPAVSRQFQQACEGSVECSACRLASRLRQVRRCVVEPNANLAESEWALAHAWGALQAAQHFLQQPTTAAAATTSHPLPAATPQPPAAAAPSVGRRLDALAVAPEGLGSLRSLVDHCAAVQPARTPSEAATAEALFLAEYAKRLEPVAKASTLKTRAVPGDKAARSAAAALNLKGEVGAIAAVRKEAEAQAQRQVQAECRRSWKLLPASKRQEWQRWAKQKTDEAERWRHAVVMMADLARDLRGCLGQHGALHVPAHEWSRREVGDAGVTERLRP